MTMLRVDYCGQPIGFVEKQSDTPTERNPWKAFFGIGAGATMISCHYPQEMPGPPGLGPYSAKTAAANDIVTRYLDSAALEATKPRVATGNKRFVFRADLREFFKIGSGFTATVADASELDESQRVAILALYSDISAFAAVEVAEHHGCIIFQRQPGAGFEVCAPTHPGPLSPGGGSFEEAFQFAHRYFVG